MLQKLKKVVKKLLNNKKVPVVTLGIVALLILTAGLFTPMTQPTTASKKKLPIYCVDTQGKKQVSISFDAAWGAGKWGRCLLPYEITLLSNLLTSSDLPCSVLLPYEITLLSNHRKIFNFNIFVLLPYEITLLSNNKFVYSKYVSVLLPYEITLLSNKRIIL